MASINRPSSGDLNNRREKSTWRGRKHSQHSQLAKHGAGGEIESKLDISALTISANSNDGVGWKQQRQQQGDARRGTGPGWGTGSRGSGRGGDAKSMSTESIDEEPVIFREQMLPDTSVLLVDVGCDHVRKVSEKIEALHNLGLAFSNYVYRNRLLSFCFLPCREICSQGTLDLYNPSLVTEAYHQAARAVFEGESAAAAAGSPRPPSSSPEGSSGFKSGRGAVFSLHLNEWRDQKFEHYHILVDGHSVAFDVYRTQQQRQHDQFQEMVMIDRLFVHYSSLQAQSVLTSPLGETLAEKQCPAKIRLQRGKGGDSYYIRDGRGMAWNVINPLIKKPSHVLIWFPFRCSGFTDPNFLFTLTASDGAALPHDVAVGEWLFVNCDNEFTLPVEHFRVSVSLALHKGCHLKSTLQNGASRLSFTNTETESQWVLVRPEPTTLAALAELQCNVQVLCCEEPTHKENTIRISSEVFCRDNVSDAGRSDVPGCGGSFVGSAAYKPPQKKKYRTSDVGTARTALSGSPQAIISISRLQTYLKNAATINIIGGRKAKRYTRAYHSHRPIVVFQDNSICCSSAHMMEQHNPENSACVFQALVTEMMHFVTSLQINGHMVLPFASLDAWQNLNGEKVSATSVNRAFYCDNNITSIGLENEPQIDPNRAVGYLQVDVEQFLCLRRLAAEEWIDAYQSADADLEVLT